MQEIVADNPSQKWKKISVVFGILTILPLALYVLFMLFLAGQADKGVSGTEIIAITIFPLLMAFPVFLGIDVILAIVYLIKKRPDRKHSIFPLIVITLGTFVVAFVGLLLIYGISGQASRDYYRTRTLTREEARFHIMNCDVSSIGKDYSSNIHPNLNPKENRGWGEKTYIKQSDLMGLDQLAKDNSERCGGIESSTAKDQLLYKSLTVEEATKILDNCRVIGFYYPDPREDDPLITESLSKTGIIVVTDNDGKPIRIHIDQSQVATMVPIARNAQKTCKDLQFWNGTYEQRDAAGNWH